jgi:hypothetical protein
MQVSGAPPKSQLRRATRGRGGAWVVAKLATKLLPTPHLRPTIRECLLRMRATFRHDGTRQNDSHLKRLESQPYTTFCVDGLRDCTTMTGRKTSLAVPIREIPASLQMKSQLLSKLWDKDIPEDAIRSGAVDADAYLDYYVQQCDIFLIEQKRWLLSENDKVLLMATHQDIIDVAEKVISGQLDRRGIVKEILSHRASHLTTDDSSSKHPGQRDGVVITAVDWAVRLVTMLEIGQLQSVFQSREPPTWKHQSLRDYLAGVFVPGRPVIGHVRLEESFNVQSLQKLANLEIEWTNDLMSHLSLIDDDKKVLIFHHVTFLEAMNE